MSKRLNFDFNTGISAHQDGKFNEEAHREVAVPLRNKIVDNDGIAGAHVGQYGGFVTYEPTVLTVDEVYAALDDAVAWVAVIYDGLAFPLRGQKTPKVVRPPRSHLQKVIVRFNTDLIKYPIKDGKFDDAAFIDTTESLLMALTALDGIRGHELHMSSASFTFDTRITTAEKVEERVRQTLKNTFGDIFFPWHTEWTNVQLTFTVVDA